MRKDKKAECYSRRKPSVLICLAVLVQLLLVPGQNGLLAVRHVSKRELLSHNHPESEAAKRGVNIKND